MLLFVAQIVLTILAFRNGWRFKALIPVVSALVAGFLIGVIIILSGNVLIPVVVFTTPCDIAATIFLIVMVCNKPQSKPTHGVSGSCGTSGTCGCGNKEIL